MARTPMYDPRTSEARSAWLAGLTEACNKLSGVLDLKVGRISDLRLNEIYISKDDRFRLYQAPLSNKLWMSDPAPEFRKNGIIITPERDNFTIDYLGGSIAFERGYTLTENDLVTVTTSYIVDESNVLESLSNRIENISNDVGRFKGYYLTEDALHSSLISGSIGDYAFVGGETNAMFIWNEQTKTWENVDKVVDLSAYYKKGETDELLSRKEQTIVPHGDSGLSDSFYYGGRKTWVNIFPKILSTVLSGFSLENKTPVSENDTVLSSIGKLQAQINDYSHDLFGIGAPTTYTEGRIGQDYTNISNGNKYHLVSIDGNSYNWEKYQNASVFRQVTLFAENWIEASGKYEQTVAVQDVLADSSKQAITVSPYPDITNIETVSEYRVFCERQSNDILVFIADAKPTEITRFNVELKPI